ncbi:MAG: AMP-binding protein [Desulfovibrio sp.]|nr:AMP-binding protein [Desulfovibrio sp.]
MGNDSGIVLDGLTDEQQALLDMFLEKEDFQAEQTEEEHPVIEPRPEDRHKPFPLTDIQLAYVIGRSNNALAMSNVSSHGYFEFSVDGLDPARYEAAWRKEIARHDMLRMIILPNGTQQVLEHVPPYRVPVNDFSAMDEAESGKAIQGIRERLQQKVKPLDEWPLFDIELTKLSGERWIIHLSLEGLTGDVKSMQIMMGEVQAFYNDPGLELKPLSLLFRDYVLSLENRRSMPSYKAAKDYWMKRIPDLPGGPVLPVLPDAEVVPLPEVKPLEQVLEPPLWNALQEKCSRHGLSPTSLLIAAFAEVVRRWNAEDDFCLNLTLFNRLPLHEEIDAIVGDFTDTLLLECRADDGRTFLDRALALRDRLWSDLDNHQFSGMDVLRELNRTRSEKENVYMPVVFTSTFLMGSKYGTSLSTLELGGHPVTKRFNSSQTPQLLIDHQVYEDHGELRVHWDVRSEFFRPGFLESMYGAFMDLLGRLAQDDAVWEAELVASLPAAEAGQRKAYNATKGPDGAGMLMHRLFLDRCETHPEALAAVSPEGQLSYAELRDRAAAVCRELRGRVACEELVAVIMPKCLDQLAAVIGIQWAGAAYLPIDPSMPEERVRAILASAGARFAVTTSQTAPNWPDGIAIVLADRLAPGPGAELAREPDLQKPENLAYVIYTSGSTGTPKGVMIEHRACVNTLLDVNERIQAGPRDRVLALSNLGFDLSVWDIFGLLAAGGCLVLPSQERIKEPAHWLELAERHGVTLWNTVPAMMRMLCDWTEEFAPNSACRLKAVLLSGDWLPLDLPERIQRLFGARVWSLGGATEASIWSIMYPVGKVDPRWKSIPYGYPMRNQTFHVLNERLEDCPCHVRGALYIGGAALPAATSRTGRRRTAPSSSIQGPANASTARAISGTSRLRAGSSSRAARTIR